ncbi:MAG: phage holin family protein [Verrucomicrobiia bacterium]
MPRAAKQFLQRWAITTVGVLVAANLVPGIHYDTVVGLLLASLLLGVLNAVIRPVMMILALPLLLVTLGLFVLVINGFLLYVVGSILKSFHVDSFWAAFWGALVISLVSLFANVLLGTDGSSVEVHHRRRPPPGPPGGQGPIIDV